VNAVTAWIAMGAETVLDAQGCIKKNTVCLTSSYLRKITKSKLRTWMLTAQLFTLS
jgi:hypothetical protein